MSTLNSHSLAQALSHSLAQNNIISTLFNTIISTHSSTRISTHALERSIADTLALISPFALALAHSLSHLHYNNAKFYYVGKA